MTDLQTPPKGRKKQAAPLSVRLNAEELARLEALAAACNMRPSTYLKEAALNKRKPRRKHSAAISIKDKEALLRIYGELRRSGLVRTFNTIANALMKGQAVMSAIEKTTLLNACADIQLIRRLIEKALDF